MLNGQQNRIYGHGKIFKFLHFLKLFQESLNFTKFNVLWSKGDKCYISLNERFMIYLTSLHVDLELLLSITK